MIEGYRGETAFRDGVRIYLRRHAEANASADDFWHALDESSGQDVTRIANAWIKEPGHPLVDITAREKDGGLELSLSQTRYFSDAGAKPTAQRWPVPLVIRTDDGERRILLGDARATVGLAGARWYYPNAGGRGFYRFRLDELSERRLDEGDAHLPAHELLRLLAGPSALTPHGNVPLAPLLQPLR